MSRLPSNPASSPNPRPAALPWGYHYRQFSTSLVVPTEAARNTMRSSKSQLSLRDMGDGAVGSDVDRTANSTPAAKGKHSTFGQGTTLLSPIGKPVKSTKLSNTDDQHYNNGSDGGIRIQAQAEDNVFGSDLQPLAQGVRFCLTPDKEDIQGAGSEITSALPKLAMGTGARIHAPSTTLPGKPTSNTIAPRPDRLLEPITPSNAQGILPPAAAIFVANLSVNRTDEQLEVSCHEAFDKFGECIVKVRRDKHRHPFALIQYHAAPDASRAIEEGQQLLIDGRRVRVEPAECRRSLILSRVGGGAISTEDAKELLGKYGAIARTQPTTHADARNHGVPEGMWVEFGFYLDAKDCLKAFNNTTSLFRVSEAPNLEPRSRPGVAGGSFHVQEGLQLPRSSTDQKSIYVGNLPEGTTEAELIDVFSVYGEIKGCNIIRKPITGGTGYNIFGFVEFATEAQALPASVAVIDINGQRIRVEQKEYSSRRHRRCQEYDQEQSIERNRHGLPWSTPRAPVWGRSSNNYRSPRPQMPYGGYGPYSAQPILMIPTPQGLIPFHPGYQAGYGWTKTPPSSAPRQRGPGPEEFFMAGPPPQFVPVASPTLSVAAFHSPGLHNAHKFARQYQ